MSFVSTLVPIKYVPKCLQTDSTHTHTNLWSSIATIETLPLISEPILQKNEGIKWISTNNSSPIIKKFERAQMFLAPRSVSTFIIALLLPISNDTDALRFLEPWFIQGKLTLEYPADAKVCMQYLVQTAKELRGAPLEPIQDTIFDISTAFSMARTKISIDMLVSNMRYTCMIRPMTKVYIALLGAMCTKTHYGVDLPRCVLCTIIPDITDINKLYLLILQLPTTLGMAFEQEFAKRVFGNAKRPCLREAMTFCILQHAPQLWMALRFPTSRSVRRGLAALEWEKWTISADDFTELIRFH